MPQSQVVYANRFASYSFAICASSFIFGPHSVTIPQDFARRFGSEVSNTFMKYECMWQIEMLSGLILKIEPDSSLPSMNSRSSTIARVRSPHAFHCLMSRPNSSAPWKVTSSFIAMSLIACIAEDPQMSIACFGPELRLPKHSVLSHDENVVLSSVEYGVRCVVMRASSPSPSRYWPVEPNPSSFVSVISSLSA